MSRRRRVGENGVKKPLSQSKQRHHFYEDKR